MPDRRRRAEARAEAREPLGPERDLRQHHQHLPAGADGRREGLEIDLRLARAGHAVENRDGERPAGDRLPQRRRGPSLSLGENRPGAAHVGQAEGGKLGQRDRLDGAESGQSAHHARAHPRLARDLGGGTRRPVPQQGEHALPRGRHARLCLRPGPVGGAQARGLDGGGNAHRHAQHRPPVGQRVVGGPVDETPERLRSSAAPPAPRSAASPGSRRSRRRPRPRRRPRARGPRAARARRSRGRQCRRDRPARRSRRARSKRQRQQDGHAALRAAATSVAVVAGGPAHRTPPPAPQWKLSPRDMLRGRPPAPPDRRRVDSQALCSCAPPASLPGRRPVRYPARPATGGGAQTERRHEVLRGHGGHRRDRRPRGHRPARRRHHQSLADRQVRRRLLRRDPPHLRDRAGAGQRRGHRDRCRDHALRRPRAGRDRPQRRGQGAAHLGRPQDLPRAQPGRHEGQT